MTGKANNNQSDITRRNFILTSSSAVAGASLALGCGDDKDNPTADKKPKADPAAKGTPWDGTDSILDLRETLHMADIYHHGEFIDFGTAARFKYTLGDWMTGWANDMTMNGISFTWASKSPSRLYFTLEESKALTFIMRVKKGGNDAFSVYLNDKPLDRITIKGSEWEICKSSASADKVLAGENYLKIMYTGSDKEIAGKNAAFAIDYLRIVPQSENASGEFLPPHQASLKQQYKEKDKERKTITVGAPTTLSYYLDIPKSAALCMVPAIPSTGKGKGAPATLTVKATPVETGSSTQLFNKTYNDSGWNEELIDLNAFAGKLVKIDIIVTGGPKARLAIGDPTIRIKPVTPAGDKKVKNVVVLLIDTLRADKLTAYNKTRVKTGAFDKFSKESTKFERCQANSNWTKPSCASVLTGLHPDSHKARGHSSILAKSVKMASELFRMAGFSTGAFIANGYLASEFGFNRGWTKYTNFIRENLNTDAENVYKSTLDFIKEQEGKPFFTYVQTIDPHVPYDPPSEDLKLYDAQHYEGPVSPRSTGNLLEDFKRKKVELNGRDRRRLESLYDGEITYHDRHFGQFLDGLNKMGKLNDTAIIVCSDHGEEFFDHDSVGHGHTLYQELLHVPLAIRAPGVVPGGISANHNVTLSDILPTALAATGQPIPKTLEGRNLIPMTQGQPESPHGAAFSSFYSERDGRNLQWSALRGNWKMRMRGPVNTYVYNLASDVKEKVDVDTKYPLALRALRIALGQFIGAPDKKNWTSDQVAASQVTGNKASAKEEKNDIPDDLKEQLRKLGYFN